MITEILFAAIFSTAAVQETGDLKRDMAALEMFLKDQENHKKYCPSVIWVQPGIEVYKRNPVSHLPIECKK